MAVTAENLIEFLKTRDPTERYDTVIVQTGEGKVVYQYFERSDIDRLVELTEMTPIK